MRVHPSVVGGLHRCIVAEQNYFLPLVTDRSLAESIAERTRTMFGVRHAQALESEQTLGKYVPCIEIMAQLAYVLVQPHDLLPVGYEIHKSHSIDVFNQIGDLVYQCHPSLTTEEIETAPRFHTLRSRYETTRLTQTTLKHIVRFQRVRALDSLHTEGTHSRSRNLEGVSCSRE